MRGEKIGIILELICKGVSNTADLFEAFLATGYGATPGKINRELAKIEKRKFSVDLERQAKQNYHSLLFRLKRDGLVREKTSGAKKFFTATKQGRYKLVLFKKVKSETLPSHRYIKEPNSKFTIVAFDIPEQERRKRNWLRLVLRGLGFTMIQQSVFIGKVKIPENFLEDLRDLKLINCVEIFEISKAGSLLTQSKTAYYRN